MDANKNYHLFRMFVTGLAGKWRRVSIDTNI